MTGINRISTRLGWKGIYIRMPNGKERVAKIQGDSPSETPAGSFIEGVLKGTGVALIGGGYQNIAGAYKATEGAIKVYTMTRKVGGDRWTATKAAFKGGILGGVKGYVHGLVDSLFIGLGTAGAMMVLGPVGIATAPIIGGVYNFAKHAIRRQLVT